MKWQGDGPFEAEVGRIFEGYGFVPVRRGWPDYAIFRRDGTLKMLVEVKAGSDTVSFQQHLIHDMLRTAGIEVRVIRPEDLDALNEELMAGRSPQVTPRVPRKKGTTYCTDALCGRVLRHPAHRWRHARPKATPESIQAAALRRVKRLREEEA